MSPFDLLASVSSPAVAVMLALVALAFLTYAPALMAPTPLNRVLRAIRRIDGARAGSFTLGIDGAAATGTFTAGRDTGGPSLFVDVAHDERHGRFSWDDTGTELVDGRRLTARETRERIESGACGEAWMQAMLAVVRDGRLRLGAAVRAFTSAIGARVSDIRRIATRFVLAGPWRDGLCDMGVLGGTGTARVRLGDDGLVVDAGAGSIVTADWMLVR